MGWTILLLHSYGKSTLSILLHYSFLILSESRRSTANCWRWFGRRTRHWAKPSICLYIPLPLTLLILVWICWIWRRMLSLRVGVSATRDVWVELSLAAFEWILKISKRITVGSCIFFVDMSFVCNLSKIRIATIQQLIESLRNLRGKNALLVEIRKSLARNTPPFQYHTLTLGCARKDFSLNPFKVRSLSSVARLNAF